MPIVHVNNFSYGLINPVLGYLMSCLGAFIGLRSIARARAYSGFTQGMWLALASVAIGATSIWAMHFIAMLGLTIPGQTILYNVPLTIASLVVAVGLVAIGLFITGLSRSDGRLRPATGAAVVGLGVASPYYLGIKAISIPDVMKYNAALAVLSVLIAIAAGIAALWGGRTVRGIWATLAASLIVGVGVTAAHYLAVAATTVYASTNAGVYGAGQSTQASGEPASSLLLPILLGIGIFTFLAAIVLMLAPSEEDIMADARLAQRLAERPVSHHRR